MARVTKIALAVIALAAFGWALTNLKPLPQWILIAIPLLGLLLDTWAAPRIKPRAFLLVTSVAGLFGLLFAGSTVVTMAKEQLFPNERQVMPVASLIAGAALGLGVFALCMFWLLRPGAALDRTRRTTLALLLGTALVAVAIDRMLE